MARIRWQIIIASLGVLLLVGALGYLAFHRETVLVPDRGGTYVEGIAGSPHYLNPILSQHNQVDTDLVSLIFNGLTDINEKGEIVPDLAEKWQVSEDGLTYTFRLREDVLWQDEVPFSADDVLFTIRAIRDADFQGPFLLANLWSHVEVAKMDEHTITFTLEEPFAPFIDYTAVGILPAHILKEVRASELPDCPFNLHPVGTGPFKVVEMTPEHIILEANALFYRERPYVDRLEFKFYPDQESVLKAYQRGEVEGISRVLPQDFAEVSKEEDLRLYSGRLSGYGLIFLNLALPVFQEKGVRQALLTALDRQEIIDEALSGQGLVAHSPMLLNSWAYHRGIKEYAYDPEGAKELLEEAGWRDEDGDGVREKEGMELEFILLTNDEPTRMRIAMLVGEQLEKVGVRAKPRVASSARLVPDFLRPRRFEALLYEWWALPPDPDPYPMWHSTQVFDNGQNYPGFNHREADELMEEARRITDRTARMQMYLRFQEIFAEEVPSLLLYYPIYSYAVDEMVRDVQVGPMTDSSDRFRNIAQWYIKTKKVTLSDVEGGS